MKRFFIFFMFILTFLISSVYADDNNSSITVDNKGKLVKKSVIVLNFYNSTNNKDTAYLADNIPESVTAKIRDTDSFRVRDRAVLADIFKQEKIDPFSKELYYNTALIRKIAEKANAEVAVTGIYTIDDDTMKIIVKAIRIDSGEIPVHIDQNGAFGSVDTFDTIDSISIKLAEDMEKKLPPEPQKIFSKAILAKYTFKLPKKDSPYKVVAIEGDFNGWKAENMDSNGSNWEKTVNIDIYKKINYEYRYIFDGKAQKANKIKFKLIEGGKLIEDIDLIKPSISLKIGGSFSQSTGLSGRIKDDPPVSISLSYLMFIPWIPVIGNDLRLSADLFYFSTVNNTDDSLNANTNNWDISWQNIAVGLNAGYNIAIPFVEDLYAIPMAGGGIVYQSVKAEPNLDLDKYTTTNIVGFAKLGFDANYFLNEQFSLVFNYSVVALFDEKMIYFHQPTIGGQFIF